MKSRDLSLVLFVILLSASVFAQGRPGGGGGGGGTGGGRPSGGVSTVPRSTPSRLPNTTPLDTRSPIFLSGKVTVDDGTPLTDPALIQSVCRGRIRNEGYTDSKGTFSIDLSSARDTIGTAEESGSPLSGTMVNSAGRPTRSLRDCDLQAVLPGFTSRVIELNSKMNDFGNADVGTIVLHRMGSVEGFTISATSALAPGKAKKQYDKGREAEKKGKFDEAAQEFTKAVEIYPKYAVAWYELGRVELQQKRTAEAKASFQQAVAADDKFISPYAELAQIALNDKQWKDLAEITSHLTQLNPLSFPQYWFYNSVANYFLQNFDAAEKSAVQAANLDVQHKMPRTEYLLGMVLVQKKDYQGAMTHIRNYIRLAPSSPETEAAQKQIAELERLSAPTTSQNK